MYKEWMLALNETNLIGYKPGHDVTVITFTGNYPISVYLEQEEINLLGRNAHAVRHRNHDIVLLPFEPVFDALEIIYLWDAENNLLTIKGLAQEIILEPDRTGLATNLHEDAHSPVMLTKKDSGLYINSMLFDWIFREMYQFDFLVRYQPFIPLIYHDLHKVVLVTHDNIGHIHYQNKRAAMRHQFDRADTQLNEHMDIAKMQSSVFGEFELLVFETSEPFIITMKYYDYVMLPAHEIFQLLNLDVTWDAYNSSAVVTIDGREYAISNNLAIFSQEDRDFHMGFLHEVTPQMVDDVLYISHSDLGRMLLFSAMIFVNRQESRLYINSFGSETLSRVEQQSTAFASEIIDVDASIPSSFTGMTLQEIYGYQSAEGSTWYVAVVNDMKWTIDLGKIVTENGFSAELIAVGVSDNIVDIYITLEDLIGNHLAANRLDDNFIVRQMLTVVDSHLMDSPISMLGSGAEIIDRTDNSVITMRSRYTFSHPILGLELSYRLIAIEYNITNLWDYDLGLDLTDIAPQLSTTFISAARPGIAWGGFDDDYMDLFIHKMQTEGVQILQPHVNEILLGLEGIDAFISGIGIIDGRLHIQLHEPFPYTGHRTATVGIRDNNGEFIDINHMNFNFAMDSYGNLVSVNNSGIRSFLSNEFETLLYYTEFIFEVDLERLSSYSLIGNFSNADSIFLGLEVVFQAASRDIQP